MVSAMYTSVILHHYNMNYQLFTAFCSTIPVSEYTEAVIAMAVVDTIEMFCSL